MSNCGMRNTSYWKDNNREQSLKGTLNSWHETINLLFLIQPWAIFHWYTIATIFYFDPHLVKNKSCICRGPFLALALVTQNNKCLDRAHDFTSHLCTPRAAKEMTRIGRDLQIRVAERPLFGKLFLKWHNKCIRNVWSSISEVEHYSKKEIPWKMLTHLKQNAALLWNKGQQCIETEEWQWNIILPSISAAPLIIDHIQTFIIRIPNFSLGLVILFLFWNLRLFLRYS